MVPLDDDRGRSPDPAGPGDRTLLDGGSGEAVFLALAALAAFSGLLDLRPVRGSLTGAAE